MASRDEHKVFAYDYQTRLRKPDADIGVIFGTRGTDANIEDALTHPRGLWSDGVHLWVVEDYTLDNSFPYDRVTAYKLSDSTPREGYIDPWSAGHYDPFGVWGGESTVWVSDTGRDRIYAYNRTTRARQPEHDFKTLYAAGLRDPKGIWSDGSTMWVADSTNHNTKIYAFSVDTKQRVPERDINARFKDITSEESDGFAKVTRHRGLWGNTQDNIMWVVGWVSGNQKLYPFDIPPAVAPQPPANLEVERSHEALRLRWSKPANDGGAKVTAFEVDYKLSTAGDAGWDSVPHSDLDDLSVQIRDLDNGVSYDLRVRARNSVDWGEYDETSGTPSLPKPLVPRNLRAASGDQVLSVSWDPPVNVKDAPVTDYDVKYQGPGEQPQNVAHTGGLSDLKVSITPVTNGVTYRVQVQAMNDAGSGPLATVSAVPSEDFETLAEGNEFNVGIWSDGTTLWSGDAFTSSIFAYDKTTSLQVPAKNITAFGPGNIANGGLCSDGTTLWALNAVSRNVFAHTLPSGSRDSAKDFSLDSANNRPFGLWCDSATLWVGDSGGTGKIYAYAHAGGDRDVAKGFDDLAMPGIGIRGIAADGETMWIAGRVSSGVKLFAYSLDTKGRVPSRDIPLEGGAAVLGLWADDDTAWIAEPRRLSTRDLPPKSKPQTPEDLAASPGETAVELSWSAPSDDGGSPVTSYDVQYRKKLPLGTWRTVDRFDQAALLTESIAGLDSGAPYDFEVRAVNSVDESDWTSVFTTTVATATAPAVPRRVMVSGSDESIAVTWARPQSDGGDSITSYKLQHRVRSPRGAWMPTIPTSVAAPATSTIITGLANGTAYDVQVRAHNSVDPGSVV